jgi:hypothetical protein
MKITTYENNPKVSDLAPGTVIRHRFSPHGERCEFLIISKKTQHLPAHLKLDRRVPVVRLKDYSLHGLYYDDNYVVVGSISE